jgi:hypothetical protein
VTFAVSGMKTRAKERVMSKCKEDKCVNEVDTFYYCDDHFEEASE